MSVGTAGLAEPDDGAHDFGGAALVEAKEFAQRLDPAAAEAYTDHLALIIECMSEVEATYLRVSGELEFWQSDAGARCAERLDTLRQHAKLISEVATEVRAAMVEAAGMARQTRNRTADLDDWQVPSTSAIAQRNSENLRFAQYFRNDLDGSLLRTIATLGTGLASVVGGVVGRAPTRAELLRDPYGTAAQAGAVQSGAVDAGTAQPSPTSAHRSAELADAETDRLASTLPLSQPVSSAPSHPAAQQPQQPRQVSAWYEPATPPQQQLGVFGAHGFDGHADGAAGAAPHQHAIDWMSAQDTGQARQRTWQAPLIDDHDPQGSQGSQDPNVARRAARPIISAHDYEPPPFDRGPR